MGDPYYRIRRLGAYFGYPACCIEAACVDGPPLEVQIKAGNNSGFFPCPSHAMDVVAGKVQLKDLITSREHSYKFPNHKKSEVEAKLKEWADDRSRETAGEGNQDRTDSFDLGTRHLQKVDGGVVTSTPPTRDEITS